MAAPARLLLAGFTVDPPGAAVGPRRKAHDELIWIMQGEAKARFGARLLKAGEGTVLYRRAGVRDYYEWSSQGRTVHAYLHFLLSPAGRRASGRVPAQRQMPPGDVLRPLFRHLLHLAGLGTPAAREQAQEAFSLLWRAYASGQVEGADRLASVLPEAVDRATRAIREHALRLPPRTLRLPELAAAAHASQSSLSRLFRRSLGMSPLAYARLARLERAAQQLLTTPLSVKDVAQANGFYDAFHLSRLFRRTYGLPPLRFRAHPEREWLAQRNPIIQGSSLRTGPK